MGWGWGCTQVRRHFFKVKGVEGKTVGPVCPSLTDKILKEDK